MQSTNNILLIRPANFGVNDESSTSNAFQNTLDLPSEKIKTGFHLLNKKYCSISFYAISQKKKKGNVGFYKETDGWIRIDCFNTYEKK